MKIHYQLLKLIAYSSPVLLFGSLNAQESDPFVKNEGGDAALNKAKAAKLSDEEIVFEMQKAEIAKNLPKQIYTTVEIFSLPANEAIELKRLKISGAEKYEKVIKMVKEKKATLELFSSIKSRSGERSTTQGTQAHMKTPRANADARKNSEKRPDEGKKEGLELLVEGILGPPRPPTPLTPKGFAILKSEPKPAAKKNDPFGDAGNNANERIEFQKAVFEGIRNKDLKSVRIIDMRIKQSFSELLTPVEMKARGFKDQVVTLSSIQTAFTLEEGAPIIVGTFTPVSIIKERDRGKKEVWLAFVTAVMETIGK